MGFYFIFLFPHHTEFLFYIIFFLLTAGLNYFLTKALIFIEAVETVSTPHPRKQTIHKYFHSVCSVNMWTKEVLSCFKFALYQ